MVYGILRMINFAHGEILMGGAFAGYFTAIALNDVGFLNSSSVASVISIIVLFGSMQVAANLNRIFGSLTF